MIASLSINLCGISTKLTAQNNIEFNFLDIQSQIKYLDETVNTDDIKEIHVIKMESHTIKTPNFDMAKFSQR